jgi:hypothetical protein
MIPPVFYYFAAGMRSVLQELARHHDALDLVRALVDLGDLRRRPVSTP